jgi:hypothetical protein
MFLDGILVLDSGIGLALRMALPSVGYIGADMVSFLICFSIDAFFWTELFHKLNLVANFEFTFFSFAACDLLLIMFLLLSVEAFNMLLFSEQQDVFREEIDIVYVTLHSVSPANLFSFVFFYRQNTDRHTCRVCLGRYSVDTV